MACSLGLSGSVWADVIHLKNGRTMEGEVSRQTPDSIHLEVRGGKMVLPRSAIARVERKARPQDAFAAKLRQTDSTDPEALDDLALWASSRGLGQESQNLTAQANGIRLQQRVDAIRGTTNPRDWIEVYHFAQHRHLSSEVQVWLLEQAAALDPDHHSVRMARRERELALSEAEAAREAEVDTRNWAEKREARARRRLEEKAAAAEQARIDRLEAQVAAQQERIEELEDQPNRRRIIRRRGRGGVGVGIIYPNGTGGIIRANGGGIIRADPACPPPPPPPPPPTEPAPDPNPVSIRGG